MKTGDSNRITREYFESILLEMRHIGAQKPQTVVTYLGETFATPVATAALSHLDGTCENGMEKMAEGALMAGAVCFSGMAEREELERMCSTGAKVIKIIKPHADNEKVMEKIREAEECGAFAIGMDIDHAMNSNGEYDCVCGLDMRPKSFEELKAFIESTKLPFIIKGVLSERDAKLALAAGAKGIIISHHHGIMDYAIPPLMVLPRIAKLVKGSMHIWVDCCVESGMDVFKALALGADGVCVGRAIMSPLKEHGAKGVCDTLQGLNRELCGAMARTGFANVEDINDTVIWRKDL